MTSPTHADALESPIEIRLRTLLESLSTAQKVRLINGGSFWELAGDDTIALDPILLSDGPSGVRGPSWDERETSLSLPSPTAIGASWDQALTERIGRALGNEARRKGVKVLLGPTVNLQRSPLGGRHFEAYSEDPFLTGTIGTAFVKGVQSQGIAATAKHYVCNDSETDRMTVDIRIQERTLREIYLAPFERMVRDGGVWAIMSAYNSVNGTTMTENTLLTAPLKTEWGFDGVVLSDWTAVRSTVPAARSGQDIAMPGPDGPWAADALLEAFAAGELSEEEIDDKVLRILRLASRVGALPGTIAETAVPDSSSAELTSLARETAVAGTVLVRNSGILPLTNRTLSLAVLGPHAERPRFQGGGSAAVFPEHVSSPLEALREALAPDQVRFAPGIRPPGGLTPLGLENAIDPETGEPGIRVRFFDAHGGILLDERRHSGKLTWMGDPVLDETHRVVASAHFIAPSSGTYRLGFAGLGQFTLKISESVVSDEYYWPEGTDPFIGFLTPPHRSFAYELRAGERVELVLEHLPVQPDDMAAVVFTLGFEAPFADDADELAKALELAKASDVAVVVVGTTEELESEGYDRETLSLPTGHDELVRGVIASNPRTIVVVNAGGPVEMPWLDDAAAVLLGWFGGQEMGAALAEVLLGDSEPGGRMPTSWFRQLDDAPATQVAPNEGRLDYENPREFGYRAAPGTEPMVPFGFGLGYTSWEVLDSAVTGSGAPAAETIVSLRVQNTGSRPGKSVIQLYLSRESESAIVRPHRWLVGYAVVRANAGEVVSLRVPVEQRAFEHWSVADQAWRQEPGSYRLEIGWSSVAPVAGHTIIV